MIGCFSKKKSCFLYLAYGYLWVWSPFLFIQAQDAEFERLSVEDGLSQGFVNCIIQDRKGFLWFGTQNGLNRYDGKSFKIYRHNPYNPNTLSDNWILSLYEDRFGRLWVGTYNRGLNCFDPDSEKNIRLVHDPKNPASLSNDQVWAIEGDRYENLWVGTLEGLNRLSFTEILNEDQIPFTRFIHDESQPKGLSHNSVNGILEDSSGDLWIVTEGGGLNRFERESETFVHFRHDPDDPSSLAHDKARAIVEDGLGNLWIGTRGGLSRFSPKVGAFEHYHHDPNDPTSLSQELVQALGVDQDGRVWVGSYDQGLNLLNRGKGTFTRYSESSSHLLALASNRVRSIYQDRSGLLWIGTSQGVSKYRGRQKEFSHYRHEPESSNSLSHNLVQSIYVEWNDTVWIGTWGGGLNRLQRGMNLYRHYLHDPKRETSISSNIVTTITQDREGILWVGTANGLNRFEKISQTFRSYYLGGQDSKLNNISVLFEDMDGYLWIGTWGSGLNRATFDASGEMHLDSFSNRENSWGLNHDQISCILQERTGVLWVGTSGTGIYRLDPDESEPGGYRIRVFRNDHDDRKSLSSDQVEALHDDGRGGLWVATLGGGLNYFEKASGRCRHYSEAQGLPSDVVRGILSDDRGNLWLSTNRGLCKFNPASDEFRTYDVRDGLQGNEFGRAYFKSARGEFFVGGSNGVNSFFPNLIKDNPNIPPVVITGFKKFNKEFWVGENISAVDELVLSYKDRVVSFEFAALDFTAPEKNQYAYMLKGLDEDWNYLGARPYVTFFNLDAGKYTLTVRGSNNAGIWNEEGTSLKIVVVPPPFQTWWAYSLYALAVIAMLAGFLRLQANKLEKERFIGGQLKRINEQLTLSDKIKDEFLANTSHELRTPLNAMIGIADSMIDGAIGPLSKQQTANLSMIVSSGMRLSNLVNDILDFSKLRRSGISLKKRRVDLHALTQLVLRLNKPLIRNKEPRLLNQIEEDCPLVHADESRLEQILQNLVGNAIKFTESGTIKVSACLEGEDVAVSVADTGIGIAPEKLGRIFESFEQGDGAVDRSFGGTGLGLAITKKLVELHGGEVRLSSEPGFGSTFTFTLPVAAVDPRGEEESKPLPLKTHSAIFKLSEGVVLNQHVHPKEAAEGHVLIVDDEPINLQVLTNLLSLRNYSISQASNGAEALAMVEAVNDYDLILMDVMMPKLSGYEVCRRIRLKHSTHDLPIIMLTAKNHAGDVVTGFEAGANDYIVKPVAKNELFIRIQTHLDLLKTSRKLKASKQRLEEYNRTLAQKVEERTRELKERNEELESLDVVVQTINREVELAHVLQSLLKEALTLFTQAERGLFLVLDRRYGSFRIAAVSGYDLGSCQAISLTLQELTHWFATAADDLKRGVRILGHYQIPDSRSFLKILPRPESSLVMTVVLKDQIEGFLILNNFSHANAFDDHDMRKLDRLKAHVLSAFAKARNLEEVQQKNREILKAQEQLKLQEKMAYLGNLTAGIAHEIQNPLNFVNNFATVAVDLVSEIREVLQKEGSIKPDGTSEALPLLKDLRENARLIFQHGKRADRIVRDMLMHSQPGPREKQPVKINRFLEEQFQLAYRAMCALGDPFEVELKTDFDEFPDMVEVVPQNISRVVLNLVNNAFYTLAEKKRIFGRDFRPTITLHTRNLGDAVELTIADNGLGIAREHRGRIFTPFFTTKPTGKGIGLGLSICYDIVVQGHQGRISFQSEEGEFTEFIIRFPLEEAPVSSVESLT